MNRVCVIIPMFGKEEYTRKCIKMTYANSGIPIDIIVVDDGSKQPFINKHDYRMTVLRLDKNSGFTNAVNQGILFAQQQGYEYVLLLNNDTEPRPNFLKKLVDEMDKDVTIGIAGSSRLYKNGDVGLFSIDLIRGHQATIKVKDLKSEVISCLWITFCSVLIRMSMICEIGLLDKHMRNNNSDNDYCLRARMADYKVVSVTDSIVFHHHSVTIKSLNYYPESDQAKFLEKLAGLKYMEFMHNMPLDCENKTWGQVRFEIVKR